MAALKAQADAARSNLGQRDRDGKARVDAAREQTTAQIAAKSQTAKATLEDALAGAQSMAAQAMGTYVQLLALAQLGLANQLPGGTQPAPRPKTGRTCSGSRDTLTPATAETG